MPTVERSELRKRIRYGLGFSQDYNLQVFNAKSLKFTFFINDCKKGVRLQEGFLTQMENFDKTKFQDSK